MGIKLDWEIEAEQAQVRNTGEDEESKRRRRQARGRIFLLILLVLLLFGAVAGGIVLRLRYVDEQIEQALRATVEAEVAALRIGDRSSFLAIQRSATDEWLAAQEQRFDAYQQMKLASDIQLTGRILDLEIDGKRARVVVEEIIEGVAYGRAWFYWNYDDGWRHVPPDYTFWGEVKRLEADNLTVRFREMDEGQARAMRARLDSWLTLGCRAVNCNTLPEILVEIVPAQGIAPGWSPANPWLLQAPSALVDSARVDMPFEPEQQEQVARLLAERLVAQALDNLQPVYPADAVFLRDSAVSWLIDRFLERQPEALLIQSLADRFGEPAVGRLLQALQPQSDIAVLGQVTGTSLDQAGLDWRDFLAWRLNLEQQLIGARNESAFVALYDTADEAARNVAYSRFNAGLPPEQVTVVSATPGTDANGAPVLQARVQMGNEINLREVEVLFRLVNGVWKRVN